jgi:hypothetical protein
MRNLIKKIRRKYIYFCVTWYENIIPSLLLYNNATTRTSNYTSVFFFKKSYTQPLAYSGWTIKVQLIRPNWLSFVFWTINNRDCLTNRIHVRCLSPVIFPPLHILYPPIAVHFSTFSSSWQIIDAYFKEIFIQMHSHRFKSELFVPPKKLFEYHSQVVKYYYKYNKTCIRMTVKYYYQLISVNACKQLINLSVASHCSASTFRLIL